MYTVTAKLNQFNAHLAPNRNMNGQKQFQKFNYQNN